MTATRLPVKSTGSCGQRLVKYTSPANRSSPSTSACLGMDRQPVAITTKREVTFSPSSVLTCHSEASSAQRACRTRVEKVMWRRRSCLSAT